MIMLTTGILISSDCYVSSIFSFVGDTLQNIDLSTSDTTLNNTFSATNTNNTLINQKLYRAQKSKIQGVIKLKNMYTIDLYMSFALVNISYLMAHSFFRIF